MTVSRYQKSKIPILSRSYKRVLRDVKDKRQEIEVLKAEIEVMKKELHSKCVSNSNNNDNQKQRNSPSTKQNPSPSGNEKQESKPYFTNSIRTTLVTPKGTKRKGKFRDRRQIESF